jgi:hypothetical protein
VRDERFIAMHRGGTLSQEKQRLLAAWAADCAERVLLLFSEQCPEDERPKKAITVARAWARGEASVGEAQAASVAAHAAARAAGAGAAQYAARAAGHAVATAHMADHAPGAAMYAIRALKLVAGKQGETVAAAQEHLWQKERLPEEIRELVLSTFAQKFAFLGV